MSQRLRSVPSPASSSPPSPPPHGDDAGQPSEPPPRAQIAIRSDFTILLAVDDLSKHDLTGRVFWTCIELTEKEAKLVRERGVDAEQEIAAKLIGNIPKRHDPSDS